MRIILVAVSAQIAVGLSCKGEKDEICVVDVYLWIRNSPNAIKFLTFTDGIPFYYHIQLNFIYANSNYSTQFGNEIPSAPGARYLSWT